MSNELTKQQNRLNKLNRILAESKRKTQNSEWDCDLSSLSIVFIMVDFLADLPFPLKLGIGATLAGVHVVSNFMFDANTEAVDQLLTEANC